MKTTLSILCLSSLLLSSGESWGRGGYANEIIALHLADPSVLRRGNDYFICGTEDSEGYLKILHSADLLHWQQVGHLFEFGKIPDWIDPASPHIWNGGIQYNPQTHLYYYYYSAKGKDHAYSYGHHISVATSSSILGPWEDRGSIHKGGLVDGIPDGQGSVIDAFFFMDDDGLAYLYWQEEARGRSVAMGQLSEDWLSLRKETIRMVSKSPPLWTTWENEVREGCSVYKVGSEYRMLFSGGSFSYGGEYAVGILSAPTPQGPWKAYRKNPVLRSDEVVNAPGILRSLIPLKNGQLWGFHHGFLNRRGFLGERSVFLTRLKWNKNGSPLWIDHSHNLSGLQPQGEENLLLFGDFSCGMENPAPWALSGSAAIEKQGEGFQLKLEGEDAEASQKIRYLPRGIYRVEMKAERQAAPIRVEVSDRRGILKTKTVHSGGRLELEFNKESGINMPVWIKLVSKKARLKTVRVYPVFIQEFEAEHSVASVGRHPSENASNRSMRNPLYRVGQGIYLPALRIPETADYVCSVDYATGEEDASVNVFVDGRRIGKLQLPATGTTCTISTKKFLLSLPAGEPVLYVKYEEGNQGRVALDCFRIAPGETDAPGRLEAVENIEVFSPFSADYFLEDSPWKVMGRVAGGKLYKLEKAPYGQWINPDYNNVRGWPSWLATGHKQYLSLNYKADRSGRVVLRFPVTGSQEVLSGLSFRILKNNRKIWPKYEDWRLGVHLLEGGEVLIQTTGVVEKNDRISFEARTVDETVNPVFYSDPKITFMK